MSRKKSPPSNIPAIDGRHNMTSLELSEADDLATLMTVDAILGFTTHKMDKNFNPANYDKKLRDRWKEIMEEFITELNYEHTYHQLVFSDKIKPHWKKDERFKRHIFRFLYLFDTRSGIEVRPCYRYENEDKRGAAIFATREWERGSQISTLFGCISEVRPSEEEFFHETKNEFSVMYSTRKNCSQLWLGPAAYVNHDCKPNCRFTEANYDSKMTLETLRDIHPNDELLIYYGNNFFGVDNAECECFTCELRGRGLFNYHCGNNSNGNGNCNNTNGQHNGMGGPINGLYFSPPMTPRSHTDFSDTNSRRVITRSSKLAGSEIGNGFDTGALNGLKKSDNSYCLRITYSRIDRVKKKILSRNSMGIAATVSTVSTGSTTSTSQPVVVNPPLKPNLKRKRAPQPSRDQKQMPQHCLGRLPVQRHNDSIATDSESLIEHHHQPQLQLAKLDPHISQRRSSLRQSTNARKLSCKTAAATTTATATATVDISSTNSNNEPLPLRIDDNDDNRVVGKLTIKLRKTADHPNQYEHCLSSVSLGHQQHPPPLSIQKKPKLAHQQNSRDPDSNIFSRMTQLYLSRSLDDDGDGDGVHDIDQVTPPQCDTPPFLSPWFCSEKSSSHSSRKSKTKTHSKSKSKIRRKPKAQSTKQQQKQQQLQMQMQLQLQQQQHQQQQQQQQLHVLQQHRNHLRIVNLNSKPKIHRSCCGSGDNGNRIDNNGDLNIHHLLECGLTAPETSSSDIPSYSASSPTIPILEIESETELVPPQLVCEEMQELLLLPPLDSGRHHHHHRHHRQHQLLLSSSPPASPASSTTTTTTTNTNTNTTTTTTARNKGIVMRFSRICGNRFISLLS